MVPRRIGEEPEQCPWDWDNVRKILALEIRDVDQIGHCPFCGRFFETSDGWPRIRKTNGGRRFGTKSCWQAWRFDQQMEEAS